MVRRDPLSTKPNLPDVLDPGEKAAVTLAIEIPGCLVLCDEREARRVCAELKIQVIGSLGLIAQAVEAGRVDIETAVRAMEALPTRGRLHVTPELIACAIATLRGT